MAHVYSTRIQFVREIALALGLDPDDNHITGITLDANVDNVATVTVRMLADATQDNAIAAVLKRYRIEANREPTTSDDGH